MEFSHLDMEDYYSTEKGCTSDSFKNCEEGCTLDSDKNSSDDSDNTDIEFK